MFIPDMPNIPPQNVPVMIAQANQAQPSDVKTTRTLGICFPVPNEDYSLENVLVPALPAEFYLRKYENRTGTGPATITVLQQPKHGILRLVTEADRGTLFSDTAGPADPNYLGYAYLPETGYLGKDSAIVLVEIDGIKVKLVYFFQAIEGGLGNTGEADLCAKTGTRWKISSAIDANGNSTFTSVEYQSPTIDAGATTTGTAALASTLSTSILNTLSVDPSLVTFNLADLPGGAVGQTVGSTITLDTNAAGYNWFIDTTPADNSEYLPTSNPYEWVAKEGSDAYGKMDMLSVLLHEYGHALGIDHSADNHDYMATTLTPGVRRMPSAEEMALMQQLVALAKGDTLSPTPLPQAGEGQDNAPAPFPTLPFGTTLSLAFLGRLRGSRYGDLSIAPDYATLTTKYAVAANATFANLGSPAGWNTQGSVDIAPSTGSGPASSATLNEASTSQVFMTQQIGIRASPCRARLWMT